MIQGIGIDIVELERMAEIIANKPNFIDRVLTRKELAHFVTLNARHQIEYLGGRFAAKEAFSKAMQTGIGPVSFQDVEILNDEKGAPYVVQTIFVGKVFISISHSRDSAIAQIILENEK